MAYEDLILAAADKYQLDPDLVRRVMRVESGGNPRALSSKGAIGPMQLMPGTARDLNVDPWDPAQNIDGGTRYLAQQIRKFGTEGGLAAYNGGPGRFEKVGRDISRMPSESQDYVRKTMGSTSIPTATAPGSGGYDSEDPAAVYQWLMQNSPRVPVQQMTPEQQQMMLADRQRKASMLPLAIAGSLSGDKRMSAMGAGLYKDANAASGPLEMEGGYMLPNGQIVENPLAASNREEKRQDRALSLALQAATNASARRQSNDLRLLTLAGQQANRENSYTQTGVSPEGKPILTNKGGLNFTASRGENGEPTYSPYEGSTIPKDTFDKNVAEVQKALASGRNADDLIKQVEANPDAFGFTAGAVSMLPEFAKGRVANWALSPDALTTRTNVMKQAAQEINELYGAALSMGEQQRAAGFVPDPKDPPELVIQKLKAARDWAQSAVNRHGVGVRSAAEERIGRPAPQAAPAQGGLSAQEQAELETLRKQFGR